MQTDWDHPLRETHEHQFNVNMAIFGQAPHDQFVRLLERFVEHLHYLLVLRGANPPVPMPPVVHLPGIRQIVGSTLATLVAALGYTPMQRGQFRPTDDSPSALDELIAQAEILAAAVRAP
jgi:hypothetical protein